MAGCYDTATHFSGAPGYISRLTVSSMYLFVCQYNQPTVYVLPECGNWIEKEVSSFNLHERYYTFPLYKASIENTKAWSPVKSKRKIQQKYNVRENFILAY